MAAEKQKFEQQMKEELEKLRQERDEKEKEEEAKHYQTEDQRKQREKERADERWKLEQAVQIERDLNEVVPKIVEINAMCREMGRNSYAYCPEIVTSIRRDGRRYSRIVVRFYPDPSKVGLFSEMSCQEFTDIVYQRIKDLYASVFEDEELSEAELNS